ncbi:MAG: hypothetical protein OEO79_17825 [Gemmatimonadota bacterium]|nr:hypothetical protein [Gemmatimonadota bacterium]MDH3424283.1 hypothetical protein [Gemmatimonadota bacterium]
MQLALRVSIVVRQQNSETLESFTHERGGMNWDAIGAVAEIVAALGVIASLVYLGTQVRGGASQARETAVRSVIDKINRVFDSMVKDEEVCDVWVRGSQSSSGLRNDAERVRYSALLFTLMKPYEELFHYREAGGVDDWAWEGLRATLDAVVGAPGFSGWWSARRSWFSEAFREYITSIAPTTSVYQLPSMSWAAPVEARDVVEEAL